ncbi:hypothetical protein [Chromobacterium sp. ATCC 53434]|uniref:hypothetical protein n=1 Tax=Chromobacterium sp. (strain ATCC 53434 / SC 14030) TaxID=2059672 RepID=UPI00130523DB|nr:hypothetical protein [Chromobacterium sp. ATCC 53434]
MEYKKADKLKTSIYCYVLSTENVHAPFKNPNKRTFYLDPKINDSYQQNYTFPSNGVTCASAISFQHGIGSIDLGFEAIKVGSNEDEDTYEKRKTSYRAGAYRHYKTFYLDDELKAETDNWADRTSISLHGNDNNGLSNFFFPGLFDFNGDAGKTYNDAADALKNKDSLKIGGLVMRDRSSYAHQIINSTDATFTLDAFCGLVEEALQVDPHQIPHHSDPLLGLKIISTGKRIDLTFKQQSTKRTLWTAKLIASAIDQISSTQGYFALCDGGNTVSIGGQSMVTGLLSLSTHPDKQTSFSFKGLYGDEKVANFYIYYLDQPFSFLPFDGTQDVVLSIFHFPSDGSAEAPFLFGNLTIAPLENVASKTCIRSVYSNPSKSVQKGKMAIFTPNQSFIMEDVLKGEKANVRAISSNPFDLFLPENNNVPIPVP